MKDPGPSFLSIQIIFDPQRKKLLTFGQKDVIIDAYVDKEGLKKPEIKTKSLLTS